MNNYFILNLCSLIAFFSYLCIIMRLVLIGAGNLATNMGKALKGAGHDIIQVYSRTMLSARMLADVLECDATDDLQTVSADADIYILSVKDAVLEHVANIVCNGREERLFLHTAGSVSMTCFLGKAQNYGVLYPMQTFSKSREVDFREIPCFIEANSPEALQQINRLAASISNHVVCMSSNDRKYLHLAAVWACNFTNHCYDMAAEILEKHGISFRVMLPLIDETAKKVHTLTPRQAQTGPAVRYDENVIRAQIQLMKGSHLQQKLYEQLSKSIHQTHLEKKKYD